MAKNKSVFGIYLTRSDVESGVTAMKDAGFSGSDVSVLLPENLGSRELVTEKGTKARKERQSELGRERQSEAR
jgi:hypothetical protein